MRPDIFTLRINSVKSSISRVFPFPGKDLEDDWLGGFEHSSREQAANYANDKIKKFAKQHGFNNAKWYESDDFMHFPLQIIDTDTDPQISLYHKKQLKGWVIRGNFILTNE